MTTCLVCQRAIPAQAQFCDRCGAIIAPDGAALAKARSWIIGSEPGCDLVVAQSKVSGRHCRLTLTAESFQLEDLGSTNGTWVNGERITAPVRVSRADTVTLGRTAPMPWPQVESAAVAQIIRIGREPDNDLVLDQPMISSYHARVLLSGSAAVIEDLGSTNGTALGQPEHKIQRGPLKPDDIVYFGSYRVPAAQLLPGKLSLAEKSRAVLAFKGESMILGRDPSCDHVLDYPMISWQHARLMRHGGTISVEDLGSTNGTYVNGERISGIVTVKPGEVIGLGSYTLKLTAAGQIEQHDCRGHLTIEARKISVSVPGRKLLDDVSLTLYPSELVGLMGPAGAGKTTLMMALNGYTPPTSGAVLFGGQSLYANYNQFCGQLGYVPQDDIMHRDLTVRQALYYTARLRLPGDYREADIQKRIRHVISQMSLEGTEEVLIGSPEKKGISGGQRKRVNLAMELLSDPSILFLDEPTSGLSSEDALKVMRLLRQLANEGKTILITIHQPSLEVFRMMDNLVVVARDAGSKDPGQMAYFGPAYPDAAQFFNPTEAQNGERPSQAPMPEEVLRGLATCSTQEWVKRYAASKYHRQYVADRAGQPSAKSEQAATPKIARHFGLSQWATLVRRSLAIKARDFWNTVILFSQAPIIALLIVLVFGKQVSETETPQNWAEIAGPLGITTFLLVLAALWFGCSNSAREIVGEWAIYHRERMVNLKIPSYVASKLTVLGGLCVVQCLVLLGIVSAGCGLKGPWLGMFVVVLLTAFVGVAMGLLVSVLARTSEVAIALMPLILLPMVILGGALFPKHKMPLPALADCMPSRWAYEAMLVLEAEEHIAAPSAPAASASSTSSRDMAEAHFPRGDRVGVAGCAAILVGMLVALVAAMMIVLKRRDVHRR